MSGRQGRKEVQDVGRVHSVEDDLVWFDGLIEAKDTSFEGYVKSGL